MPGKREAVSESQLRENLARTVADSGTGSPLDQWAKAEFLIGLTRVQIALAQTADRMALHKGKFFRSLSFLVEFF